MGLVKGHTFSDGETVTAAKLNNLVDSATIANDTVTTAMIGDNQITAAKLATDSVNGASIQSASINYNALVTASGSTRGVLIQSGVGGVYEELTPHATTGYVLQSNGSSAPVTYGTIGAVAVGSGMISDHTEELIPVTNDVVLIRDTSAGANKRAQLSNLFKVITGLSSLTSGTIADDDELVVYDDSDSTPKKITKANLLAGIGISQSFSAEVNLEDLWDATDTISISAHGLSTTPSIVNAWLEVEATDAAYSWAVGDRIKLESCISFSSANWAEAFSVSTNATNIYIGANAYAGSTPQLYIPDQYGASPSAWSDHNVVKIWDGSTDLRSKFKIVIKAFA